MKQMLFIAMLLGGAIALRAPAQNSGSNLEDARRRELDLMNAVSEQERHNSQLRNQLRGVDANGTQQELVNASADAAALRKRLDEIRIRRDVMHDKLENARRDAITRFEAGGQTTAARKAVVDATAELERLSRPIIDRLSQSPDYQEAQALVDAAAQTGEAMQSFPGLDANAMAKADAAFDQAMSRVREMEDAAVLSDPAANEAKKTLKVAQDTLAGMQAEFEKRLADEPGVVSAQLNFDTEDRLYSDIQAKLTAAETRVAALQQGNGGGAAEEMARQLKEGEARLAELNEQVAQAKIAREDAEERQAYAQQTPAASGPAIESGPYYPPADYSAPEVYYDPWYSPGYTVYPTWGYAPYYGYSYCYPYSHSYYRPYFYSGLYLGFSYYSSRNYHHGHHGHYDHDRYRYGSSYGYHNDSWRGDRYRNGSHDLYRSQPSYANGSHSSAWNRNRDASSSLSSARAATNDAERDYRWRTGAGYSGSSGLSSLRTSDYERSMQERRSIGSRSGTDTRTAHVEPSGSHRSTSTVPPVNSDVKSGRTIAARPDSSDVKSGRTIAARTENSEAVKRIEPDRSGRAADELRRAREASDAAARARSAEDAARSRANDASRSRSVPNETRSRGSDTPPARTAPRVESAPRSDRGSSARSGPRSDSGSSVRSPGGSSGSRSDPGSRGGGVSGSSSAGRGDAGGSFRSGGGSSGSPARSGGSSRGSSGGGGSSSSGGRRR